MAVPNKSVIVRSFNEVWEEGYFAHTSSDAETIAPGTLVYQASGGQTIGDKPSTLPTYKVCADVNYPPQIVIEDTLQGKTIADKYATGDLIRVKYLLPGEKYVVYGKAEEAIAVGTLLSPHTDGTVTANAGPGNNDTTLFRAETAVADTDTGIDRQLVVRVLRV